MIQFTVNKGKSLAALQFLIGEANNRGHKPTQYELVKALFLADRAHLNHFGRPITFDRYVAMVHGPVPSFSYDALKNQFDWAASGLSSAPWVSEQDGKVFRFSVNTPGPSFRNLSESDKKCLADALTTVLSLSFGQIRALTHQDPAYLAAWRDDDSLAAFPMDMSLLLDESNSEALDDIRYLAEMTSA